MSDAPDNPPDAAQGLGSDAPQPEKKKRGKPKDPNAPKKPKNGYQQFTERRRPELKEQEPALAADLGAFGKRLAEEWTQVPQAEKDRLQAQYEKEMAIWKPLFAKYKESDAYKEFFEVKQDWMDIRARKKLNKTMNKDAPKRPKSGYMIYTGSIRDEVMEKVKAEGLGMGDGARIMSERWAALPESEKARFAEMSAQQKTVFDVEFLKYRQSDAHKNYLNAKSKMEATQKVKKLTRVAMSDAPKRPASAFAMYRGEVMPSVVAENEKKEASEKMDVGKIGKHIAAMWTDLDAEKKQKYYAEAEKQKEHYDAKLVEWKSQVKYTKFLENRSKVKATENRQINLRDLPKRPKSVFALFAEDHKNDVPHGKGEGKGRHALKTKWSETEADKRQEYETKEKELKEEWMKAVAEFKESDKYKLFEKTKKQIEFEFTREAEKATTLRFLRDSPNPPPKTPFAVYLIEKRKRDGTEGVKKDKKAKVEEIKIAQAEWLKLDRDVKKEYEVKRIEIKKSFEQSCKDYMLQDKWKDYVKEAKRMRLPVKALLFNKKLVIKKINGVILPSSIPLPRKPDTWPDRPKTAMQIFTKEKRSQAEEISKLGEMWTNLSADERGKYDDLAAQQQKQYEKDTKDFRQSDEGKTYFKELKIAQRKRIVCGAKIKFLKDYPKKPKAAVVLFMTKMLAQVRKEHPQLKGFEIKKMLSDQWVALGVLGQAPYNDEAKQLQRQYEDELNEFKKSDKWKGYVRATAVKSRMKIKAKVNVIKTAGPKAPSSMPKKPPTAVQAFGQERPGLKPIELQKAFAELSEEDRKERMAAAQQKKVEYEQAMQDWKISADGKRFAKMQEMFQRRMKIAMAKKRLAKHEPRKPLNAYQVFSNEMRTKLIKENSKLGPIEMNRQTTEAWAALTDDAKQELMQKEAEEKEEYEKAMTTFKSTSAYKQHAALLQRLTAKGSSAPKLQAPAKPASLPSKPLPALIMYQKSVGGSIKEQREGWVALGAQGQAEWQSKAKEAEQQYQKDLLAFNRTAEGKKYQREKLIFEKRQKMQLAKKRFLGGPNAPTEPKKPPSAYFIFVQEKRSSVAATMDAKASTGEIARRLTEIWQKFDREEKKEFEDKAIQLKTAYDEQVSEYKNSAGYKSYMKAMGGISGAKARKAAVKAKARAKKSVAAAKAKVKAKAKARGAPTPAADSASDSDMMGSDSDDSSSSNSDSD